MVNGVSRKGAEAQREKKQNTEKSKQEIEKMGLAQRRKGAKEKNTEKSKQGIGKGKEELPEVRGQKTARKTEKRDSRKKAQDTHESVMGDVVNF